MLGPWSVVIETIGADSGDGDGTVPSKYAGGGLAVGVSGMNIGVKGLPSAGVRI